MTLNLAIIETVVAAAQAKASGQPAWVRAIEKAAEQLYSNPYISEHDGGLLILSYSQQTYHANGACQCKAYANGKPCWHRAANQLVRRYREAEAAQAAPAPVVAAKIKPMFEEEARNRMLAGTASYPRANLREGRAKSAEQAADIVNVSPRSVESANRVIEQGAPQLIAAVEQGRVSVSAAAEVATLSQAEQQGGILLVANLPQANKGKARDFAAEAVSVSPRSVETVATDERATLISDIKAAWHHVRPFASLDGAVRQVFGVARLEDVATDDLRKVLSAQNGRLRGTSFIVI